VEDGICFEVKLFLLMIISLKNNWFKMGLLNFKGGYVAITFGALGT